MNLIEYYTRIVAQGRITHDNNQLMAVERLEALKSQLSNDSGNGLRKYFSGLLDRKNPNRNQGLYMWGGVGRGKTWLMDLFFDALPFENKLRLHFRHFMQEIHDDLDRLRGQRDPLHHVAKHFAQRSRILCLDEFYVEDITDAMILYRLLDGLIRQGQTIVFTSNLAPDELYRNGLQRERFLPAIALIKDRTEVIHLDGDTDHRLNKLKSTHTYFTPVNIASEKAIERCFIDLAPGKIEHDLILNINHRQIPSVRCGDDIGWFEFHQLCIGPRASADYIELARRFHTICLSGVPIMTEANEEWAHRFVNLVDEFYDRRVKLIISAETEPQHLYKGKLLAFEFQRTISRLLEMRSHDYLAEPHRP